jgi:hypothetical protein
MVTKNSPFYSVKFNRPDTIKSHRTKQAAMNSVKDFGMIYETESGKEFQVHAMTNNTFSAFKEGTNGYSAMDFKFKAALETEQLINIGNFKRG